MYLSGLTIAGSAAIVHPIKSTSSILLTRFDCRLFELVSASQHSNSTSERRRYYRSRKGSLLSFFFLVAGIVVILFFWNLHLHNNGSEKSRWVKGHFNKMEDLFVIMPPPSCVCVCVCGGVGTRHGTTGAPFSYRLSHRRARCVLDGLLIHFRPWMLF